MDTAAEIAALKQEVTQLKKQLQDLTRFLHVQECEEKPGQKVLMVECSGVMLRNPADANQLQGMFCAGESGPVLSLWGSDDKARVVLEVENDHGTVRLFQKDLKIAVELGETSKDEPYVAVFNRGNPRAQLKGTEEHGIVAGLHDDGQVRVAMISQITNSDVLVVGGDMRTAVKLSSEGKDGGGFLTVNHANGKAAAIVTSTPQGGLVILNDSRGQLLDSLPSVNPGQQGEE